MFDLILYLEKPTGPYLSAAHGCLLSVMTLSDLKFIQLLWQVIFQRFFSGIQVFLFPQMPSRQWSALPDQDHTECIDCV